MLESLSETSQDTFYLRPIPVMTDFTRWGMEGRLGDTLRIYVVAWHVPSRLILGQQGLGWEGRGWGVACEALWYDI
jgi:hypothetical protein